MSKIRIYDWRLREFSHALLSQAKQTMLNDEGQPALHIFCSRYLYDRLHAEAFEVKVYDALEGRIYEPASEGGMEWTILEEGIPHDVFVLSNQNAAAIFYGF